MNTPVPVTFYFDFISPYSWMAVMQAETFARRHGARWEFRPVVYAVLLNAHGLVGPAEVEAKRELAFRDTARCAAQLGLTLEGPPEHPFRSLEALRTVELFRDTQQAEALVVQLSDACWGRGRPLTDFDTIVEGVEAVGLDATDLARRIAAPEVKQALRAATEEAIERGVFGVPTFAHDGELFWGHDRMEHLALRLSGKLAPVEELVTRMLSRPSGVERRRGRRG